VATTTLSVAVLGVTVFVLVVVPAAVLPISGIAG
jgi:hypothetical protein